jgi:hypothetical protein
MAAQTIRYNRGFFDPLVGRCTKGGAAPSIWRRVIYAALARTANRGATKIVRKPT